LTQRLRGSAFELIRYPNDYRVFRDINADRDDVLSLDKSALDGLQFGGKRNHGYGITRLKDTQVVDLEALDYSRLEDGEAFIRELLTPFGLESEYPNAHDQDVP